MKRFAAHYVWSGNAGFQKHQVIEMEEEKVWRIFPLTEEMESVEWFPGIIVLTTEKGLTLEAIKQILCGRQENNNNRPLYAYLLFR